MTTSVRVEKRGILCIANNGKPATKHDLGKELDASALEANCGHASTRKVKIPEKVRRTPMPNTEVPMIGTIQWMLDLAHPGEPAYANRHKYTACHRGWKP